MGCMFYDGDTAAVEHESLLDFSRMELLMSAAVTLRQRTHPKLMQGMGPTVRQGRGG